MLTVEDVQDTLELTRQSPVERNGTDNLDNDVSCHQAPLIRDSGSLVVSRKYTSCFCHLSKRILSV